MKFDVVIGNPSYNDGADLDFINLGYEIAEKCVCMITPAKWQTADPNQGIASKTINYGLFRQKLVPHIHSLTFYPCCKDLFDILQVDGLTYFLMDKSIHDKICIENKSKYIPAFSNTSYRSILNGETLFNIGQEIIDYLNTNGPYDTFKPDNIDKSLHFQVYTNTQVPGGGLSTLIKPRKTLFIGQSHIETNSDIEIRRTAQICTFSSNNKSDCYSFMSWLNTKFIQFFIGIYISKLTGIITNHCFRLVPAPTILDKHGNRIHGTFDHIYTDEELYKTFNLPDKYIKIIESIVQIRD